MATIRLVPSTYAVSNSSYLSVSNASNMYTNTDSDTYATVTNTASRTSSYYVYVRGFNFSAIPSGAIINSFEIKLKARQSGITTSTSYKPYLANGTSAINGSCPVITTTATVHTFTGLSADFDDIVGYGSNFGIRINCRKSSSSTTGYMYIYGAEIEVDYTVPVSCTITSTLTGNGTISPSGATSMYEDEEYTLTITPTDKSDTVTVTNNGIDVSSQLVSHGVGDTAYTTPDDVTTSDIQSGSSYAQYAIGHSAESPSSSGTSSNMYASTIGYASYSFDLSAIPSGSTIESVSAKCYGHRESSTIDSTHVSSVAIYNGSTQISEDVDFPSTSNSIITVEANQSVSYSDLSNITVRHTVGYYGGLVLGITLTVVYSIGSGIDHYTYTFTTTGDATIAVVIGSQGEKDTAYIKVSGAWVACAEVYKKVSGAWVLQTDLSNVFDENTKYVNGD